MSILYILGHGIPACGSTVVIIILCCLLGDTSGPVILYYSYSCLTMIPSSWQDTSLSLFSLSRLTMMLTSGRYCTFVAHSGPLWTSNKNDDLFLAIFWFCGLQYTRCYARYFVQ